MINSLTNTSTIFTFSGTLGFVVRIGSYSSRRWGPYLLEIQQLLEIFQGRLMQIKAKRGSSCNLL